MSKPKDEGSWKNGGIKRRDFRHTAVDDTYRFHGKRKDTRRWCRGKIGKLHTIKTRPWWKWGVSPKFASQWVEDYCTTCGKVVKFRNANR